MTPRRGCERRGQVDELPRPAILSLRPAILSLRPAIRSLRPAILSLSKDGRPEGAVAACHP